MEDVDGTRVTLRTGAFNDHPPGGDQEAPFAAGQSVETNELV